MAKSNNAQRTRPGVLLYFDTLQPALARLTDAQCGQLLRGVIEYAQTGALPELDDLAGMAFDLLRPGIDRDGERYEYQRLHGQYMAYCRQAKDGGETPISEQEYIQQLSATNSYYQLPTTTTTASTSTYPTSTPISNPNRTIVGRIEEKEGMGEKETEVAPLSQADAFLQRHKDDANQEFVLLCAQRMRDHEQQQ